MISLLVKVQFGLMIMYCIIKTRGGVLYGPRNLGHATDKCIFYRSKDVVFMHL